jgi:hypothetical protein
MLRPVRVALPFGARMWASLVLPIVAMPADAQAKRLIPSPYPQADGSVRIPATMPSGTHQHLAPLPYPRALGANALANTIDPPTTR